MNASFYHGRFFGVVSLALLTAFVSTAGIYLMNLEGKHEMIRVQLEERVEKNELSTPSSADIVYELQFQRNYLSRLLDSTIAQLNRLKCSQGSMVILGF